MNLVIVESPSKTKTIGNYLGSNYKVVSSKGHIRDLATTGKYGLGIDIENNFKPNYTVIKGKSSVIKELKSDAKKSDMVGSRFCIQIAGFIYSAALCILVFFPQEVYCPAFSDSVWSIIFVRAAKCDSGRKRSF